MALENLPLIIKLNISSKRKLGVNESVEIEKILNSFQVRSMEEGFQGSWHPGKVVHSGKLQRHVKYDNVLLDDEVNYLVDKVTVPKVLDGDSDSSNCNIRGWIRPVPPKREFESRELKFGLCVDVYHEEAWWDGVIFDHCDEKPERSVYFPDLGDEMKIGVHQMRITYDWNEVTGEWQSRGNWVFLEVLEEYERKMFISVSVKQVWYDVRTKKDFAKIGEWTFNEKELWKKMVMEVVDDYLRLTLGEVCSSLDLPRSLLRETLEMESVESTANVDFNQEVDMANSLDVANSAGQSSSICITAAHCDGTSDNAFGSDDGIAELPMEEGESSNLLNAVQKWPTIQDQGVKTVHQKEVSVQKEPVTPVEEVSTQFHKEISCVGATEVIVNGRKHRKLRSSTQHWEPLRLSDVELCPDSIEEYAQAGKRACPEKARKQLAYLGWEIEWTKRKASDTCYRYRYRSPDKQGVYYSLSQVCKYVAQNSDMNPLPSQNDQSMMQLTADNHLEPILIDESEKSQDRNDQSAMQLTDDNHLAPILIDQSEKSHDLNILPPVVSSPVDEVADEPEFCPQAVLEYLFNRSAMRGPDMKVGRSKAKRHLLAEGWSYHYANPRNKRQGFVYIPPDKGRSLPTLHAACHYCIKQNVSKWTDLGMQPLNGQDNVDQVWSANLLQKASQWLREEGMVPPTEVITSSGSNHSRKRKLLNNTKPSLSKPQRNGLPRRVLRSNKRVQKVSTPSLSHQKPQNVLSWLIDNNILLPRSKVSYKPKGRLCLAEGRITSDGIKCNCCLKVYSLAGFESHASGCSTRRPAASIILEDGRSLLDCLIKTVEDHMTREAMAEPPKYFRKGENDNICSVCHYGGNLILCDQCPSSFHGKCLGLKNIPDGDWFCPSCRCAICDKRNIKEKEEDFLVCIQCEHKYHFECLRSKYATNSRRYSKNWFCGKDCEKIYFGLHKLLGEPVSVGINNLTWTLVKYINSESSDPCTTQGYLLPESYSKLNVALSVMHECFEPLKEPSSTRDLTEDVLFSQWSTLNRLNFHGFYTVLLERNEELISAATLRVYGKKVAELPLIGTRLQYRRHGMCRILMNELEKRLMQLGVERLVLPAVPSVVDTWTGSFGFVKMTEFERSQFLDNTFLDFQGTIMCQKLLKIPSSEPVLLIESQQRTQHVLPGNKLNFDADLISEVLHQAEETDKGERENSQIHNNCAGSNDHCSNGAIDIEQVTPVNKPSPEDQQWQNDPQSSIVTQADSNNGSPYKCYYKRRKYTKF
ncbi:hypothetical protein Ahy_B01g051782 [Arachis hypogaea]|uniref:PHD-type domain-containing protein n=1 Tax=Arachis hypogaea TaxID=3818 RepID=A0A445AMX1_ARAHY|nr:hypothetical protein Ahy_B01g051782 [Arachis hypogaea]